MQTTFSPTTAHDLLTMPWANAGATCSRVFFNYLIFVDVFSE